MTDIRRVFIDVGPIENIISDMEELPSNVPDKVQVSDSVGVGPILLIVVIVAATIVYVYIEKENDKKKYELSP